MKPLNLYYYINMLYLDQDSSFHGQISISTQSYSGLHMTSVNYIEDALWSYDISVYGTQSNHLTRTYVIRDSMKLTSMLSRITHYFDIRFDQHGH